MRTASPLLAPAFVSLAATPAYAQLNYGGQGPGQSNNLGPSTYGSGRSADTSSKDSGQEGRYQAGGATRRHSGRRARSGLRSDPVRPRRSRDVAQRRAVRRHQPRRRPAAKDALNRGAQLDRKRARPDADRRRHRSEPQRHHLPAAIDARRGTEPAPRAGQDCCRNPCRGRPASWQAWPCGRRGQGHQARAGSQPERRPWNS